MATGDARHFHAFLAPAAGSARAFTCRSSDVFNSREAAHKWAELLRPSARRLVRQCAGAETCPGAELPPEREPPRERPPRHRRSARLTRLRKRLDALDGSDVLARVEALLDADD